MIRRGGVTPPLHEESGKISRMTNSTEYIPKIAMSIHAHPDDQEFSVGGTLAKWARLGCQIISVIITSGDSGSNDPAKDGNYKQELEELSEREQISANDVLGIQQSLFLSSPDGELDPTLALCEDLTTVILL